MIFKALFLFSFSLLFSAHAVGFNSMLHNVSERDILERFFRTLFEESQGGYVLYGSKPICDEGILPKETNLLMLGGDLHRRSVILREGFKVWDKLSSKNQKYFIHLYKNTSYGWQHLLLINKDELCKVVRENLSLFQYVLGPNVSPEGLFTKLIDPEMDFASVFQEDKVLIGIVLGFGTQNALHGSREENIELFLSEKENPPFKSLQLRTEEVGKRKHTNRKSIQASPSFGYSSLQQELDHYRNSLFVSKDLVRNSPSIPWFGCLKTKETTQLLDSYAKTQKQIPALLKEERFLEKILTRFGDPAAVKTIQSLSSNYQDLGLQEGRDLSSLIAQAINEGLPEHEEEWIGSFIQGMRAQENGEILSPWSEVIEGYYEVEKVREAKKNLSECEKVFSSLLSKKELVCLVPGKLYYKVLRKGNGESVQSTSSTVQMNYVIKNLSGEVLSAAHASDIGSIELSNFVVGLAAAMKGMKVGEEREIYIHPAYAYGESSNVSPNIGLVAEVKLIGIDSQRADACEASLEPLDLSASNINESEIGKKYRELSLQVASQLGARTWSHFKKGQQAGYSFDSITQALLTESKHAPSKALSSEEDAVLSRLHWKIYHADTQS